MAASVIGICNEALDMLPADRIQSLDAATLEAKTCKQAYPFAKRHILMQRSWTFLRTRQSLALTVAAPEVQHAWAHAYARPVGFTLDALHGPAQAGLPGLADTPDALWRNGVPYEIVGQYILTNQAQAIAWGRYDEQGMPEALIDGMTATAIAVELAKRIVLPITKSRERYRELMQEAPMALYAAAEKDHAQTPNSYGDFTPEPLRARHA